MKIKVEGLKQLERALAELPQAASRGVGMRVLKIAAEPIANTATRLAPKDKLHLADGIGVGTKLTRRQRALHKKKSDMEVFAGAGGHPQATQQEFGNENHPPQPFMRPAWDAQKVRAFDLIGLHLGVEIQKSAERAARKALKLKK
jgi:HK97 gp10 family phage protein